MITEELTKTNELIKNNCRKCKYHYSWQGEEICTYGSWDREIYEAVEEYLKTDICTFEGDSRFKKRKK